MRLCCLAEQEEQEWLQLIRETEETAEEASPGAGASGDAHCPVAAKDLAQPADLTSHLVPAASGVRNDSSVYEMRNRCHASWFRRFHLMRHLLPGSRTVR